MAGLRIVIPCAHEARGLPTERIVADYHPLSNQQVMALLRRAKGATNPLASEIQVRLNQGIRGMVCPQLIDGPISKNQNEIDRLYVAFVKSGQEPTQALADQIHGIMIR